jgi:hypothetical protein
MSHRTAASSAKIDGSVFDSIGVGAPLAVAALLFLSGCETPPTEPPSARDIRDLKPSGTVTMAQEFLSRIRHRMRWLTSHGRTNPFTLIAASPPRRVRRYHATGEVYDLRDLSQFSGAYFLVRGQARHFVVRNERVQEQPRRRHATDRVQSGLTLTTGRH